MRNLRAAGRATITVRGRMEEVRATELDPTQRGGSFRDVLGPLARGIPSGVSFVRIVDGVDLEHPLEAAERRPVFELHPSDDVTTSQVAALGARSFLVTRRYHAGHPVWSAFPRRRA